MYPEMEDVEDLDQNREEASKAPSRPLSPDSETSSSSSSSSLSSLTEMESQDEGERPSSTRMEEDGTDSPASTRVDPDSAPPPSRTGVDEDARDALDSLEKPSLPPSLPPSPRVQNPLKSPLPRREPAPLPHTVASSQTPRRNPARPRKQVHIIHDSEPSSGEEEMPELERELRDTHIAKQGLKPEAPSIKRRLAGRLVINTSKEPSILREPAAPVSLCRFHETSTYLTFLTVRERPCHN